MKRNEAEFIAMVRQQEGLLRRYIAMHIPHSDDAADVFQDTIVAAWSSSPHLRDRERAVGWLLQIARNRCRDHFRKRKGQDVSVADGTLTVLLDHRQRTASQRHRAIEPVLDALEGMPDREQSVTRRFYLEGLSLAEIASEDGIPVGTVKRRLFEARQKLRSALAIPTSERYLPMQPATSPDRVRFPAVCPEIHIALSDDPTFPVDCLELRWWSIIPRLTERAAWAAYDAADGKLTWAVELMVVRSATIHGVEGVEIAVQEEKPQIGEKKQCTFYGRLTETTAEYLAVQDTVDNKTEWSTFLDPDFSDNWGVCERAIAGDSVCTVTIEGKTQTCLRSLEMPEDVNEPSAHLIVSYLTREGRTLLTRHYVHERYGEYFSEPVALNPNETFTLGDVTLYHWYDMLTFPM